MTTRFFSLLLLLISSNLFAQNLVPNHSFEEFVDGCNESLNEMPISWSRWRETPNSFSTCGNPQTFSDSLYWVPWNGFGYQWPADGESYAGLAACGPPGFSQNFREYLGCELLKPLVLGETYYVSFKTSMGFTGSYYNVTYATNRLGAYFTTQGYDWEDNPLAIPNFAHVYEENVITDTVNWVTVSGYFVADEAYTHMGLGVFFDFDLLDVIQLVPGLSLGSYYYIDDVCVSLFPDCGVSTSSKIELAEDLVKVYPNPATTHVVVESSRTIVSIGMQDLSGKWVVPSRNINDHRVTWDLMDVPAGVYILDIETATVHKRKKLVVVR